MSKIKKEPKIDFVVTWVDGSDKKWQAEKAKWAKKEQGADSEIFKKWINNDIRYRDWGIFKYWFRAVEKYAPWVNKVYLVTEGHVPEWLNLNCKKLVVVKHEDFIPKEYLPTFNSNAIELYLHKINNLSENFVYFNDDMFLMSPVKQSDFFRNGKPCQSAVLDCVNLDLNITHAEINNIRIINEHFSKKESIKHNPGKWINMKYGKGLLKTIALMPWSRFTGIQENHIYIPYLKETFEKVWKEEPKLLEKTASSKFRKDDNINHWLMENWQLASGNFSPISQNHFIHIEKLLTEKEIKHIIKKKYKCACINDVRCNELSFENQKKILQKSFEKVLPFKSEFEKAK